MMEFFVSGNPRQRGSKSAMPIYVGPKHSRKLVMKNGRPIMRYVDAAKGSGAWLKQVAAEAEQFRQEPLIDTACTVVCVFCYQYPKVYLSTAKKTLGQPKKSAPKFKQTMPDTDKLVRAILDGLTGVIYTDDARVTAVTGVKTWSKYEGALIRVWDNATIVNVDEEIERYLETQQIRKPF